MNGKTRDTWNFGHMTQRRQTKQKHENTKWAKKSNNILREITQINQINNFPKCLPD